RPSRSAVSAVIPRRSFTISPTRVAGTPIAMASAFALRPIGTRNSSRSISPGWIGGSRCLYVLRMDLVVVDNLDSVRIWFLYPIVEDKPVEPAFFGETCRFVQEQGNQDILSSIPAAHQPLQSKSSGPAPSPASGS